MAAILNFQSKQFSLLFDLQVTLILPMTFRSSWPFCSEGKVQNRFSTWHPIRMILAIFDLSHPDTSYQVLSQLAILLRRTSSNRFSGWQLWQPFCTSDLYNFSYFLSTSTQILQVSSQLAFQFMRRREKLIFKMVAMAAILDF